MQFEPAFRQPGLERGLDRLRFVLSPAMNQPIIRIPTPWEVRVGPPHPEIECVMQEQVGKDRADHAPLWGAAMSRDRCSVLFHGRC